MNDAEPENVHNTTWAPVPAAARLVEREVCALLHETPELAQFAARVNARTGMRLGDWILEVGVGEPALESELRATGFEPIPGEPDAFRHPGALLPTLRLVAGLPRVVIQVDEVADFIASSGVSDKNARVTEHGGMRRARVVAGSRSEVWAYSPSWEKTELAEPWRHFEAFRQRPRGADDPRHDFDTARRLIQTAQSSLGVEHTARVFFAAEREYWQGRNRAARLQKARQDELGLGWGTLDHFTYRSSRAHFAELIRTLELLGLRRRERFHAGAEAGWGAQVMGFDEVGIAVFADVDLEPDEVALDFSRGSLSPTSELGTVGLWCCLHGEAFCSAGLHHVARQGSFSDLRALAAADGVASVDPFATLPYLKQCFTLGESWHVTEARLTAALRAGAVAPERLAAIRSAGAIGSHLELIERGDGYKGFLQRGISDIIRRTDPRHRDAARPAA